MYSIDQFIHVVYTYKMLCMYIAIGIPCGLMCVICMYYCYNYMYVLYFINAHSK